ncbi:hypothetical protein [Endozoicomonas ascidiicola]|uniref:hypothetical protein n=1 Tax=Endozoicomonas ascidiicola TaxID=1698521 RepID=UPI000831D832|nr:hypothetical protein [Endozoicomonas ascidiicola]
MTAFVASAVLFIFAGFAFEANADDSHIRKNVAVWDYKASEQHSVSSQPVRVQPDGDWLTGLVVGHINRTQWVDGFIRKGGEIKIESPALSGYGQYPSVEYALSVQEKDRAIWEELVALSNTREVDRRVYHFKSKPFFSNPYSTSSEYLLTAVEPLGMQHHVETAQSFDPEGVGEAMGFFDGLFFSPEVTSGYIVYIQRINRWVFNNQCLIGLHQGNYKAIDVYYGQENSIEQSGLKAAEMTGRTGDATFKRRMQLPDIAELSTGNEILCRYAEAAAVLGRKVAITYSDFLGVSDRLMKGDLYHIRMM